MAEKITNKLKGLFKSDEDKKDKDQPLPRGDPKYRDTSEIYKWVTLGSFSDLPQKGKEAFFWFLRKCEYPEDKDIEEIGADAPNMTDNARSYQFWLKYQKLNLEGLFNTYVADRELRIPTVDNCFQEFKKKPGNEEKTKNQFIEEKRADMLATKALFSDLSDEAKLSLNQEFIKFQECLRKDYCNTSP